MTNGKILVAFFVALLAVAITGTDTPGVGFAKECTDGLDNDVDGGIDWLDSECRDYPFADGLGEVFTAIGADYLADYYEVSSWDYDYQYRPGMNDADWCISEESKQASYDAIQTYSGGKDRAGDDYRLWAAQNCP